MRKTFDTSTRAGQIAQLCENATILRAENLAACEKIDKTADRMRMGNKMARPSAKRAGDSLHDQAQRNPLIAAMLRKMQAKYI